MILILFLVLWRRVTHYCEVENLNMPNLSLCINSSIFSSISEAYASEILEDIEE